MNGILRGIPRRMQVPSDRQRLDALNAVDTMLISNYRKEIRRLREENQRLLVTLAKGEARIYGKPVKLEWPEGRPFGYTDEQLAEMLGIGL